LHITTWAAGFVEPGKGVGTILLIEHDAKALLAGRGMPVPEGWAARAVACPAPDGDGQWVVKAQVPAGGRGKAGGIRVAEDSGAVPAVAKALSERTIGGFPVETVRVERLVEAVAELYIGLTIDAGAGAVVLMVSHSGGVDIEAETGQLATARVPLDEDAMQAGLAHLTADFDAPAAQALTEAGALLIDAFIALDATLIEINPLFLLADGNWVAGDARMDLDLNAMPRQPLLERLIEDRPETYADAAFKRSHGYDLVVTDPAGEVGLVATGAGLSMQLLDEMARRGLRPYNFCDIRSGMMRGDPSRLVENFRALTEGPHLKCVLVNIFAGITELVEFADLLLEARDTVPELRHPMIVRLVGNGEAEADAILRAAARPGMSLERDLDRALDLCAEACRD
jgi:succinyl-CoA synthetase beta subunit